LDYYASCFVNVHAIQLVLSIRYIGNRVNA